MSLRVSPAEVRDRMAKLDPIDILRPGIELLLKLDRELSTKCTCQTKCLKCNYVSDEFPFAFNEDLDESCPSCGYIDSYHATILCEVCELIDQCCRHCEKRLGVETHFDSSFGRNRGLWCWYCHLSDSPGCVELNLNNVFKNYPELTEDQRQVLRDYCAALD